MEKFFEKKKEITMSPEIKDMYDRLEFALRAPDYFFGNEIAEHVMLKEYDIILAEDASGRLPGLLMYEAMKKFYQKDELKEKINLFFLAGSKNATNKKDKEEKILDYFNNTISKSHSPDKRILLITDVIMEGKSLVPLIESLKKINIKYDILTLGLGRSIRYHNFENQVSILKKELGNMNEARIGIPEIFDRSDLSGVKKNPNEIISSRRPDNDMQKIKRVRQEIEIAAEKLYQRISSFKK